MNIETKVRDIAIECAVAIEQFYKANPATNLPDELSLEIAGVFDKAQRKYPPRLGQHIRKIEAGLAFKQDFNALGLDHEERMTICTEFLDACEAYLPGAEEQLMLVVQHHSYELLGGVQQ